MRKAYAIFAAVAAVMLGGCGGSETLTITPEPESNGTIVYTDYQGAQRTATETVGAAEVRTGTGYGETLFDSAQKKCQHCHNELYDTWKTSMHSKSWSDPIFQSKHQDFLRTHIAKIGEDKSAVGGTLYTPTMFEKGVSKTCAKCHAPTAVYSQDLQVTLNALDVNVTDMNASVFATFKAEHESNVVDEGSFDPTQPATVVGIAADGTAYTATYHIGNAHNREGISCTACHNIETVRLMSAEGHDGGLMTLKKAMRVGPHGPIKKGAGETLVYSADATDKDMNYFFRLWGPELYADPGSVPHTADTFNAVDSNGKTADGRFTYKRTPLDDANHTRYTGGPFYGPFGVTGLDNHNADDTTDRTALVHPGFDKATHNPFGNFGKGLCLACHQRSSGAYESGDTDRFMELCSTWNAVSNGTDNNYEDTATSPKCQKCHMPRLADKRVLHQWGDPDALFTQADIHLTAHFDPDDTTTDATDNPVKGNWLNDHAFVGGSKIGSGNYKAKIQSGFGSSLGHELNGSMLTVTTTLQNRTAHMLPGAHPMRRMLTRVTLLDANGSAVPFTRATGQTTFAEVSNDVVSGDADATIDATGEATVAVGYDAVRTLDFPGKTPDLNGTEITSQRFSGEPITWTAPDSTVGSRYVEGGKIKGTVTNAAIVATEERSHFTRIYGHETGKMSGDTFVVRPGFDSNHVGGDNRLQPNETEHYTLTFDALSEGNYTLSYAVYYMQKGASGKFDPANPKLMISEVAAHSATILVE